MCCVYLLNRLTSFRSISIKPYFQSKNTCDIELDELKVPAKLDKLEAPLPTLEVPYKLTEPAEPAVKCS